MSHPWLQLEVDGQLSCPEMLVSQIRYVYSSFWLPTAHKALMVHYTLAAGSLLLFKWTWTFFLRGNMGNKSDIYEYVSEMPKWTWQKWN